MSFLILCDAGHSQARGIIDRHVDKVPADATVEAIAAASAGDSVTYAINPPELLSIQTDQLAGLLAFIAYDRRHRIELAPTREMNRAQDA